MSASNYLENKIGDHVFRSATFAKPSQLWLALCAGAPTDAGLVGEFAGGNYARVQCNPSDTNWTATQGGVSGVSSGTGGAISNANDLTFPAPTADWGVPLAFAIMDASTGGNLIAWGLLYDSAFAVTGEFVPPPAIKAGDPAPVLLAGSVVVVID